MILVRTADGMLCRQPVRDLSHCQSTHAATQSVMNHGIDQHAVSDSTLPPLDQPRGAAHAFHAPRHDYLAVTAANRLFSQHHRPQSGTADLIDRHGTDAVRQSGEESRLPGGSLTDARGQHISHDDFVDLSGGKTGPLNNIADHRSAEFRRRKSGQLPLKLADRRATCVEDDGCVHRKSLL